MSPKRTVDESVTFMYICLKHKTGEHINFAAVGAEIGNLKPKAGHMRFSRLRDAIEAKMGGTKKGVSSSVNCGKESKVDMVIGENDGEQEDGGSLPVNKKRKLKTENDGGNAQDSLSKTGQD